MKITETYSYRKALCFIISITALMMNGSLWAGDLPNHYPDVYHWSGSIDEISNTSIIIADKEFKISSGISIHLINSTRNSFQDIKVGMTVGCEISNNNELYAIWQFPETLSSVSGPYVDGALMQ